jgi:hypothetical protein
VRVLALVLAAVATGCGLSVAGDAAPVGADAAAPVDAHGGGRQDHLAADVQVADAASGDSTGIVDAADEVAPLEGSSEAGPVDTYSLQFDGVSTYVDCGNVPIPADFTIEAWVNPATYNNETYVLAEDKRYQPQGQFRFGFVGGGQLFFVMSDSQSDMYGLQMNTATPYNLISPNALPTNTWSEVAVSKAGGSFTLLVGGVVVSTVNTTSFAFGNAGAPNPMRIGARVDQDGQSANGVFDGLIDEVRFWNVGRTPAEITADMRKEIAPSDPGWSSLQDYWPFDEGTGAKTNDLAGKFPGTLVNGPGWSTATPF